MSKKSPLEVDAASVKFDFWPNKEPTLDASSAEEVSRPPPKIVAVPADNGLTASSSDSLSLGGGEDRGNSCISMSSKVSPLSACTVISSSSPLSWFSSSFTIFFFFCFLKGVNIEYRLYSLFLVSDAIAKREATKQFQGS